MGMHWLICLQDENNETIDFYRLSKKIKKQKTVLNKVIEFYKKHKHIRTWYNEILNTEKIEIYFTDYETTEDKKIITVNKSDILKLLD